MVCCGQHHPQHLVGGESCSCMQVVQGRGFQQGDTAVVAFSAKNSSGQDYPGLNRPRMRIDSNEPEQLPGKALC